MSNLYTVRASASDVAAHFGAAELEIELPHETTPQTPGLIVREHNGRRVMSVLNWGFPRVTRETRERGETPKPVNLVGNLTSPMWEDMVQDPRYRCLIPLTHFAEPAGEPGAKTRTWYRVKDQSLVAWAGFCRRTPEWGPVYAAMTMDSTDLVMPLNERMPVLLDPHEYAQWLHGSIADVIGFQFRSYPSERLVMEPTADRWRSGVVPAEEAGRDRQIGLGI